jgi:hypothetical protein
MVLADSLIWVCRYCLFWCEIFDADHGTASVAAWTVFVVPLDIRTSFHEIVHERMCAHMKELFDINIE